MPEDQCQNCTLPCPGPHACPLVQTPPPPSELDAWFPRAPKKPRKQRPPEQGVIDGVKRRWRR